MTEVEMWSAAARAEGACAALIKHGFDAVFVQTKEEAAELVMKFIKPGMKVGFGGSMTVKALGIQGKAEEAGAAILDHNKPGISAEEKLQILRAQLTCDVFVSSSNAVTMKGEIMNIDGNGNRVAALTFGPRKNVVVLGSNKVVADEKEAWERIQAWASPMNNKRLAKGNPCVKTGQCMDCQNPGRICRVYQVLRRRPSLSDFTVILVGEPLGY
ncbi:MAG TPA: lactate utilization protein [Rectinemataceae bacterium]|nr:lactate utilization protein [Rectinemataceae bacterium]